MGKIRIESKINRRVNLCLYQIKTLQGSKHWLFGNFNSLLFYNNIIIGPTNG